MYVYLLFLDTGKYAFRSPITAIESIKLTNSKLPDVRFLVNVPDPTCITVLTVATGRQPEKVFIRRIPILEHVDHL